MDRGPLGEDVAREELLRMLSGYAQSEGAPAIVMVTHHVEEIPRGFTHALLLDHGSVVAAGPMDEVVTAETLGAVLAAALARGGGATAIRTRTDETSHAELLDQAARFASTVRN